jgi:hypothetical protein
MISNLLKKIFTPVFFYALLLRPETHYFSYHVHTCGIQTMMPKFTISHLTCMTVTSTYRL